MRGRPRACRRFSQPSFRHSMSCLRSVNYLTKGLCQGHTATAARADDALTNPRGLVCGIDEGEDDGGGNRGSSTRPLQ